MNIVFGILNAIFGFIKYPIYIGLAFVLLYVFMIYLNVFILIKKGYKITKGKHNKLKKRNALKRLFIDLPKRVAYDTVTKNPEMFKYKGLIVFTGRQGNGKTIGLVEQIRRYQQEYPNVKVITNLGYQNQNDSLNHWKQLTDYKNGIQGVVVGMDELQNWFSSKQSANFPPEMLSVVTQNRKNRRVILGTAQNFYMLSKDIRSQCTEVRECRTLFGALTIVHRRIPICDNTGEIKEYKNLGWYFFVHDKALRESYDTYKVIDSLSRTGFKDVPKVVQAE